MIFNKVFSDQITITKVAWCMNSGYTGWYTAGMRCGLVRIEDINFHWSQIKQSLELWFKHHASGEH